MRQRVEKGLDSFLDVKHLSDLDIARLSREHEIDIAIDLGGHTHDSRPRLFAERAAPIQINYLGYPGTWANDCMDYFIGDTGTIPVESRAYFSEKIIYLPYSFQVNPSHRPTASDKRSRQDLGLPNESFVFCCFNNSWKITPKVFEEWMQILQQVPDSVLWLYADNLACEENLKSEAAKHGVSVERIFFAKRVQRDVYLAQFQHADLFLDTLPYNAGTTASDALWAGVPVLTQIGKSFAGRMAASLLTTIGVPELITHGKEEYCSLAVELASNPERLATIKTKLTQNRMSAPLFNTELFARHIESAYKAAYSRYHAGLPPDHIYVKP
jgi:predicted O-linked N-acetylglucosamine transferase (SPINDLY family)